MVTDNEKTREKKGLLQPKNDVVFHALFTRGKESITKALLEDILKIKIEKLELDRNTELTNDNIRHKNGKLDLRAVINGNVECNIEMQLIKHDKMLERFLYYWSKIYTANLKRGEPYKNLRKTISIIIVDDEIEEFKNIEKSHTRWQIREEEYYDKILTPYLQIDILELQKAIREYEKNSSDEVLQWMKFLDNPEDKEVSKIMEENNNIKVAKEELNRISQDESLQRRALSAEIARKDYEQGLEDAKNRGKKLEKIEIAKKLLEDGMNIDKVIKITGLTEAEIKKL